jgi:hypothetical protein
LLIGSVPKYFALNCCKIERARNQPRRKECVFTYG